MKCKKFVPFMVLLLMALFAACAEQNIDVGVSNLRTALDQAGTNATATFSPTDIIYAVVDFENVPAGTKPQVKWIAVNVEGTGPNHEFDSQSVEMSEETTIGSTYFQLSNAVPWPVGQYRVDLYVNDALAESVEFSIQ
jgi:hypothetical protein